jgi:hypothetical protein
MRPVTFTGPGAGYQYAGKLLSPADSPVSDERHSLGRRLSVSFVEDLVDAGMRATCLVGDRT